MIHNDVIYVERAENLLDLSGIFIFESRMVGVDESGFFTALDHIAVVCRTEGSNGYGVEDAPFPVSAADIINPVGDFGGGV
jgi:hypothetical protein